MSTYKLPNLLNNPVEKETFDEEFKKYVLYNFLFEGKSVSEIEDDYYNNSDPHNGALAGRVLKYYHLSYNGPTDNTGIYKGEDFDDVIDFLKTQSNPKILAIVNTLTSSTGILPDDAINTLKDFVIPYHKMYIDESELFNRVNSLTNDEIDNLLDIYSEEVCSYYDRKKQETINSPTKTLRRIILLELKQGTTIDNDFILKIKGYINNGDQNQLDKYFSNKSVLATIVTRNTDAFEKLWSQPYNVCYAFFFQHPEKEIVRLNSNSIYENIINDLNFDNVDLKIWNIHGPRNHGTDNVFIALYPDDIEEATKAYQLFINFVNGKCYVGIRKGDNCKDIGQTLPNQVECQTYKDVLDVFANLKDDFAKLNQVIQGDELEEESDVEEDAVSDVDGYSYIPSSIKPRQIIFYGAPGAGKSHTIANIINKIYPIKDDVEKYVSRVIFHPDYTYGDFVGSIRPVRKTSLDYEFVPGPFSKLLKSAYLNPDNEHFLILEEINRGNAAAIFGDLFQLLDRDEKGFSTYTIKNADISEWLLKDSRFLSIVKGENIKLPNNFSILCTMNTADQNVFVLDSAFKRRFNLKYVDIDFDNLEASYRKETSVFVGTRELDALFNGSLISEYVNILKSKGQLKRNWETFANLVNHIIDTINLENGTEQISEDKKLGPYFITEDEINDKEKFINKVLYYLKQDVFKYTDLYFVDSFETLYKKYSEDNQDIFEMLCVKPE